MTHGEIVVKSSISSFAVLLAASLLIALSGCTESAQAPVAENPVADVAVPAGMVRGTVLETMDAGGYTYVSVDTGQGQLWAAGPKTTVKVGDVVQFSQGMPMNQFQSNTLNRTFELLFFVDSIANLTTPAEAKASPSMPAMSQPAVADVNVAELEAGQNIAWVYANTDSLADQSVSLRGKVVKYNSNILGWNFLHIRDGSGDAAEGNHDLAVTSKATTAVGDTVVVTGTVVLDKDFGAGYIFPVLLDDASITSE